MPKNLGTYNDDLSIPRKKDVDACYSPNNAPPYPVKSVDGKTGDVKLNDVKYITQTLTDAQKKQARENIGGVEVVISETQPTNQNIGDIWLKIK